METFLTRIRRRVSGLLDPHRQERIERAADGLAAKLLLAGAEFDLEAARQAVGISAADLPEVTAQAYRKLVLHSWSDDEVGADAKSKLQWAAGRLQVPAQRQRPLQLDAARHVFERCLHEAIEHGAATDAELHRLQQIAGAMGWEISELVHHYFLEEGEQLVGALFESLSAGGDLAAGPWQRVQRLAAWLGLSPPEMRTALLPKVQRVAERLLADARSDGGLAESSAGAISHLLQLVGTPRDLRDYVEQEVTTLQSLTRIAQGHLPVVDSLPEFELVPEFELDRGETVHFFRQVHYRTVQHMGHPAGPQSLIGQAVLSNKRLIVKSPARLLSVHHDFVMGLKRVSQGFEVLTPRGVDLYDFGPHNRLALALYGALLKAVPAARPAPPRADRDAAWVLSGGCCALCAADRYLEFVRPPGAGSTGGPVRVMCDRCAAKTEPQGFATQGDSGPQRAAESSAATF